MHSLSDQLLIQAYNRAVELNLDNHFISLLQKEMTKRNITNSIGEN
ncbi:sporulation histidine kinase inhibitor Sda [Anaerobacillus sp. MEB173]